MSCNTCGSSNGCGTDDAAPPIPSGIVTVNGTIIAADEIAHEMPNHAADTPLGSWRAAVQALVLRSLLLERARVLKLRPAPMCDAQGRRESAEEALVRAVLEIEAPVPVADAATCRRYYAANLKRFRSREPGATAPLPFEAVAAEVAAFLAIRVRHTAWRHYARRLVAAADITGIDMAGDGAPLLQ